jgi:uncharacterized protein YggT (Ycf19 family)
MSLVDLILNLVGLLLWLNWLGADAKSSMPAPGATLVSTLRPAGPPPRRWFSFVALVALLLLRALFYWRIGPPIDWVPRMPLGPTTLSFSSNFPGRIFLFSVLSFAATLAIFYLWMLLLSFITSRENEADSGRRVIRAYLGALDQFPNALKIILPLLVIAAAWCALHPLLNRLGLTPRIGSPWRLVGQGAIIGLAIYLTLKFLFLGLFALYIVNSYVYMGEFSFWRFVNTTTRAILRPLEWLPLRAGKIDLAPLAAMVVVFVGAEFSQRGLTRLYEKLL